MVTAVNNANAGTSVFLKVGPGVNIDLSTTTLPTYTNASQTLAFGDGTANGFTGTLSGGAFTFNQILNANLASGGNGTISTSLGGTGELKITGAPAAGLFFVAPTLILSGTNTYTGGTLVSIPTVIGGTAQVEFMNPGAVPATGKITGVAGAGYAIDNAFISKFNNAASFPNVAALGADSSNNLDFSGTVGNLALGAMNGNFTYSGTLTPFSFAGGGTYLLGGGNGVLTVSSNLADGASPTSITVFQGFTILSGTNSFTGGVNIDSGTLQIQSPTALASTGAIRFNNSGFPGGTLALNFAFDQTLLNRINDAGNTVGTIALAVNNSNPLDFTNLKGISLGVEGTATYSGAITPSTSGYLLGGGTGTLTVSSHLTGANALIFDQPLLTDNTPDGSGRAPATVILNNPNDDYTGATTIAYGKLQLGDGVTNGLLTGTSGVHDGASTAGLNVSILAFNEATAVSFAAPISTALALEQDGPGTVTLTGAETYTGLTYIKAGTLATGVGGTLSPSSTVLVNAGATLDISAAGTGNQSINGLVGPVGGTVNLGANNLTLTFTGGFPNLTTGFYQTATFGQPLYTQPSGVPGVPSSQFGPDFSGVIQGSGALIISTTSSANPNVLSGTNTYTGGTQFVGGNTLALGDAVHVGTIGTGPVSGNGFLQFVEPATTTLANAISGSVNLEQFGTGKVILTGANTGTGFILIGNSTATSQLQLGDGTATVGLGSGNVSDGGQLIFNEGGAITIANNIGNGSGLIGGILQTGPGAVTLNASNSLTGLTEVSGGSLVIGDSTHATAGVGGAALRWTSRQSERSERFRDDRRKPAQ